ncbi:protein of unknown function [Methylocaldum szegediense]|uniref:Uncharacterized protein n=1 Tax=Methylocaldum szegediense TaxID=73780 RepID=A0ABM9HZY7_9GAMM|nr:protein of unknown function [Methylocaldum szegediense]
MLANEDRNANLCPTRIPRAADRRVFGLPACPFDATQWAPRWVALKSLCVVHLRQAATSLRQELRHSQSCTVHRKRSSLR